MEAMWLMLQQDSPDDYVIATNETHTVREFLEETFACLDLTGMNMWDLIKSTSDPQKLTC